MAEADLKIIAIALILAITYGTFLFLNANTDINTFDSGDALNSSDYDTPDAGNFFTQLEQIKDLNVNNPEIFFVNTILFGTLAFLIVFIGLRFLRGVS